MNGYPYPVLTESDSSYKKEIEFKIKFYKYTYTDSKVKLLVNVSLNSVTLQERIASGEAELVVKVVSGIRSNIFHLDEIQNELELVVNSEDIKNNDTIRITAFVVVKKPFLFSENEETEALFGKGFTIDLRKGDLLAISNEEKLNYNSTSNDFILIKSSPELDEKGIKIRLADENSIEIMVGPKFKSAYARLKNPIITPILNSHLVFEAFVYTLVEIAQQKEDHSNKEWYRLFSQAFEVTGDTLDEFKKKAMDDGSVDMAYIFEMAQIMVNNSLESTVIEANEMENNK